MELRNGTKVALALILLVIGCNHENNTTNPIDSVRGADNQEIIGMWHFKDYKVTQYKRDGSLKFNYTMTLAEIHELDDPSSSIDKYCQFKATDTLLEYDNYDTCKTSIAMVYSATSDSLNKYSKYDLQKAFSIYSGSYVINSDSLKLTNVFLYPDTGIYANYDVSKIVTIETYMRDTANLLPASWPIIECSH
jgi:hypothetical protein